MVNSTEQYLKLRQVNQLRTTKKAPNNHRSIPACRQSRSAAIDVIILIAVIGAFGFLLYPYINLFCHKSPEIVGAIMRQMKEEVSDAPMISGCLGLGVFLSSIAILGITVCTSRKCGKPGCKGLQKAAEFDIQLETEEWVKKNKSNSLGKDGLNKGLSELLGDYHKELEGELRKMAPINGKAVLVFRRRCGCCVGRMEVPGPNKTRKVLLIHQGFKRVNSLKGLALAFFRSYYCYVNFEYLPLG